jgi:hypothetical protein
MLQDGTAECRGIAETRIRHADSLPPPDRRRRRRPLACWTFTGSVVLLGMVPLRMDPPRTSAWRSTTATCLSSVAAAMAARCPVGPLPITTRSYSCIAVCHDLATAGTAVLTLAELPPALKRADRAIVLRRRQTHLPVLSPGGQRCRRRLADPPN